MRFFVLANGRNSVERAVVRGTQQLRHPASSDHVFLAAALLAIQHRAHERARRCPR